jgi:tetratricopeptide (TPR) repeat protein
MPMWYWTLLGLLAAMYAPNGKPVGQPTGATDHLVSARFSMSRLRSFGAIACGVLFLLAAWLDLTHAAAQTSPATATDAPRFARLYADKTLLDRRVAALMVGRAAERLGDPSIVSDAAARWRELHSLAPGLHDTAARYASALLATGDAEQARRVVEAALGTDRNPYDRDANILYARRFTDDAETKLRCVQRALRGAALDEALADILTAIAGSRAVRTILDDELPAARERIASGASPRADDCDAELIRINAFLADLDGRSDEAVADQRIAARFYQTLEETSDRFRRGYSAETDALYRLARMLYDADRANYPAACEAIKAAGRSAVLGMPHESVSDPRPEDGFVIGEVVPTVVPMPENQRPLWRLFALLHVVAGKECPLDILVMFYLPPDQWNQSARGRERARLARQAYSDLSGIAEDKRPAHYHQLPEMARRNDPGGSARNNP